MAWDSDPEDVQLKKTEKDYKKLLKRKMKEKKRLRQSRLSRTPEKK